MKAYPHRYAASAKARAMGSVAVLGAGAPIETASPPQFGGPGGTWSPETLLCAAVADCFVLSFRAIARAARFEWIELDCRVEGVLERIGNATRFTGFATAARLTVPPGADQAESRLLLARAEHACLIANSLRGERTLTTEVVSVGIPSDPAEAPREREGVGRCATPPAPSTATGRLS